MNWKANVQMAMGLARERRVRHVVLARYWPNFGWMYYVAAVGSHRERELRAWRRKWDMMRHG